MSEASPAKPLDRPATAKKAPPRGGRIAGGDFKPQHWITATQPTWLKKEPVPASVLRDEARVEVPQGRQFGVVSVKEQAGDGHLQVELAGDAGQWFIYAPHWRRRFEGGGEAVVAAPAAIDWSDFGSHLTPYLTVGEVLQWDARRRPRPGSSDIARILATAEQHQLLRQAWGGPVGITSFYRPEPINSQVGGVPNSFHVTGQAFDAYPVTGSLDSFYRWARDRWTGGLGDGRAKGFVHFDTRCGGHFVPGAGRRPAAEWLY